MCLQPDLTRSDCLAESTCCITGNIRYEKAHRRDQGTSYLYLLKLPQCQIGWLWFCGGSDMSDYMSKPDRYELVVFNDMHDMWSWSSRADQRKTSGIRNVNSHCVWNVTGNVVEDVKLKNSDMLVFLWRFHEASIHRVCLTQPHRPPCLICLIKAIDDTSPAGLNNL